MTIEKEQWIALFALWTEPALAPLSETATTVPWLTHIQKLSYQKALRNKNRILFSFYHVNDVWHRRAVHE